MKQRTLCYWAQRRQCAMSNHRGCHQSQRKRCLEGHFGIEKKVSALVGMFHGMALPPAGIVLAVSIKVVATPCID